LREGSLQIQYIGFKILGDRLMSICFSKREALEMLAARMRIRKSKAIKI
jgi:hypothetical protein